MEEAGLSDHFPVALELWRSGIRHSDIVEMQGEPNRVRVSLRWNPNHLKQYRVDMQNSSRISNWRENGNQSIETLYEGLAAAIQEAADALGMRRTSSARTGGAIARRKNKPWFDRYCIKAKGILRQALGAFKEDYSNIDKKRDYIETKKRYKAFIGLKKKEYADIVKEGFSNVRRPADFWKAVKKFKASYSSACDLPMQVWNDFYSTIYPPRMFVEVNYVREFNPALDGDFTFQEIVSVVRECRSGKAAGPDLIGNEFFKFAPAEWHLYIQKMFNQALSEERVPRAWGKTALTMLFKKGGKNDPSNYRGIALVNNITKLFTLTLKKRLEHFTEVGNLLPESQLGFRRGRGCTECIFTLTSAVQLQLRLGGREVYTIFVDFKRAFDSIPHAKLWLKLFNLGISTKQIKIIKSLYEQATVQVKNRGLFSNEFEVTEGVLQGESLSPLLFLLYLADIENFFRDKGLEGINIDGVNDLLMLMYADDTVLLAHSHVDMHRKLKVLTEYCDKRAVSKCEQNQNNGLQNERKTQSYGAIRHSIQVRQLGSRAILQLYGRSDSQFVLGSSRSADSPQ